MEMVPDRGHVVVTGASSGIGRACALRLDALGFRVFAGTRGAQAGDALRKEASDRLVPIALDVTDAESIRAAASEIGRVVGGAGLAGLVNNAAIAVAGPVELVPPAWIREQLEVNVIGPMAVAQALIPLLRPGPGRIVNVGSAAGRVSPPLLGPYSASKFALSALNDSLRVELRPWGIDVVLIEPGIVMTPIWEKMLQRAEDLRRRLAPRSDELYGPAMDRFRQVVENVRGAGPDDVAAAVARALTARRPRARYRVGIDSHGSVLVGLIPSGLRTRLLSKGLPRYP
jgi:NAD(P)-dependent dehydrogenase (short-subunit alcohol dehydrogenase family)